eukprot:UN04750
MHLKLKLKKHFVNYPKNITQISTQMIQLLQQKYQEITEANDILSNEEKRQIYDSDGMEGLQQAEQRQGQPMDPFAAFFGGGGQQQQGGRPKGQSMMVEMSVSLEDLYKGKDVKFKYQRSVICPHCRGSGSHDGELHTCSRCRGQGVIAKIQNFGGFQMQTQAKCDVCGGRGRVAKHKCSVCSGQRVKREEAELAVQIERGMADGQKITFEKAADQSPQHTPGDVIVVLKQLPNNRFRREGDDLHMDLAITLKEALLGFERKITQLDGSLIHLKRTKVTQPFEVIELEGHGMPHYQFPSVQGKLYVRCLVNYPQQLSDAQKQKVNELFP